MNNYDKIVRRAIAVVALLGCFCLVLILNCAANHTDTVEELSGNLTYFTDFSLQNVDGTTFTQDDLKGHKVTVFNGWASWCTPCTGEMPDLEQLSQEYSDQGLQIIGIAADYGSANENLEEIQRIIGTTGVTYPILLSDDTFHSGPYLTMSNAFPCTWAVDEDGNVIEIVSGAQSEDKWRAYFDKWLEGR